MKTTTTVKFLGSGQALIAFTLSGLAEIPRVGHNKT